MLDPGDEVTQALRAAISGMRSRQEGISDMSESAHATRVTRVYRTAAVPRDDILPMGLLEYCTTERSIDAK